MNLFSQRKLPILTYHKLSTTDRDRFTVSSTQFERQLAYLRNHGYQSIRFSDLLRGDLHWPGPRRVSITFDDGYLSFSRIAVPLLERYGFSATCFVPVGHIGGQNEWDGGGTPLMSEQDLRALPPSLVELGLHSWNHTNYNSLGRDQIRQDVQQCRLRLDELGIRYAPVLAYPYGGVPKAPELRAQWGEALAHAGVQLACRVGNRLNQFPLQDPWMLTRTDIRGDESHWKFVIKVKLGRCKLGRYRRRPDSHHRSISSRL